MEEPSLFQDEQEEPFVEEPLFTAQEPRQELFEPLEG